MNRKDLIAIGVTSTLLLTGCNFQESGASKFDEEYEKIPGISLNSEEIVEKFKVFTKSEFETVLDYNQKIDEANAALKNKLFKSEIVFVSSFLQYSAEKGIFLLPSGPHQAGKTGSEFFRAIYLIKDLHTFFSVEKNGGDRLETSDQAVIVTSRCDVQFPYPIKSAPDLKEGFMLRMVIQYKFNTDLRSMMNSGFNMYGSDKNFIKYNLDSPEKISIKKPFVIAELTKVHIFDEDKGQWIENITC